jgi:hypothetical protein
MASFDFVYCEMDLPDGFIYTDKFQTKDMHTCTYDDGTASDFFIHKDGSLEVKFNDGEYCDLEENYKFPIKFKFYAHDDQGRWHEYVAYVENKKVVKLFHCPTSRNAYIKNSFIFDDKSEKALKNFIQLIMDENHCDAKSAIQILCEKHKLWNPYGK